MIRKCIPITANSLLGNVKDSKLKKVFDKCKVLHALKQAKNLLRLLNRRKVQNCISENMVCNAMNVKIPAVTYAHRVYKNIQIS